MQLTSPSTGPIETLERIRVMRVGRGAFGFGTSEGVTVTEYKGAGPEPLLNTWKLRFSPDFGYGPVPLPGGIDRKTSQPSTGQQAAIDALKQAIEVSGFAKMKPDWNTPGAGTDDQLQVEYYRADGAITKHWQIPFKSAPQGLLDVWDAARTLASA